VKEERWQRPLYSIILRFGQSKIFIKVIECGSKTSSGKKNSTSIFLIDKLTRHMLVPNVSFREAISLKLERDTGFTFGGKPPTGNISTFGQLIIRSSLSLCSVEEIDLR